MRFTGGAASKGEIQGAHRASLAGDGRRDARQGYSFFHATRSVGSTACCTYRRARLCAEREASLDQCRFKRHATGRRDGKVQEKETVLGRAKSCTRVYRSAVQEYRHCPRSLLRRLALERELAGHRGFETTTSTGRADGRGRSSGVREGARWVQDTKRYKLKEHAEEGGRLREGGM